MTGIMAPRQQVSPSVRLGVGVTIQAETVSLGADVVIEDHVRIEAREVVIEARARIGARTTVQADLFAVGYQTRIGADCTLSAIGGKRARKFVFGDNSFLGESSVVLMPVLLVGDYVAMHHHLLANGYKPCYVGHNTWIGQNCILNSTDVLTIGNNVGIGAYTSIYTHAYNGELLEGCQVFNVAPVVIEDNAWIVGSYNVISPGVTIGARTMILTSSVVSKDVPPLHCVGGVPAKDLTEKIVPFREVTLEEKFDLMKKFVREFLEEMFPKCHEAIEGGYRVVPEKGDAFRVLMPDIFVENTLKDDEATLVYTKTNSASSCSANISIFDLSTKQYVKRMTNAEIQIIKFMNGYRARFVPANYPRVS